MTNLKVSLFLLIQFGIYLSGQGYKETDDLIGFSTADTTYNCSLIVDIQNSMNLFNSDPRKTLKQYELNDNCLFAFVDTLTNLFIESNDTNYLICLNSVSSVSDGDLGEYLDELIERIYQKKFDRLLEFVYSGSYQNKRYLEDEIILYLMSKIEEGKNLNNFYSETVERYSLDVDLKQFLKSLIRKASKKR